MLAKNTSKTAATYCYLWVEAASFLSFLKPVAYTNYT